MHSLLRIHARQKSLMQARGVVRMAFWLLVPPVLAQAPAKSPLLAHVIEVTADHDSRYKISGQLKPVITVTAGEPILLRVTAIRAKSRNRDGSIHGFSLLRARDHSPVPGWDFLLQPGVQEFSVTAPAEPGEYEVVCTVVCSGNHEGMNMRFIVQPNGG